MQKFQLKSPLVEAITFDELVKFGADQNPESAKEHDGFAWSFNYKGFQVTHETNECYLIPQQEGVLEDMRFTINDMLILSDDGLSIKTKSEFLESYECIDIDDDNFDVKCLIDGHSYELPNYEDSGTQILNFIQKVPRSEHPSMSESDADATELVTLLQGTTNEAVLMALIDRMYFLQAKFPCRENAIVIRNLEESLMWLNKRTEDRKSRNVEGKQLA